MGDVDGGDAELLLQGLDLVAHGVPDARIEIGERLIEQENARIDRQRPPKGHTLSLPAGECGHRTVAEAIQAKHDQNVLYAAPALGAVDATKAKAVGDVFGGGHVWPERIGLKHHSHVRVSRAAGA